ncbi:MAG: antitoxin [Armatimonadetes bacterium]|nr:antitoxin [Armatimonadota bacterium]
MRTTLTIDDDILMAAKELAAIRHSSAGAVLSDLARRGLRAPDAEPVAAAPPVFRNGFEVFPADGPIVTNEIVRRLGDETEDL